jgi:nitroimidazol reductase NimA-like FMN-containing flavoprotein (pyridoxamine 5'-phosphate oxidase superfamily)
MRALTEPECRRLLKTVAVGRLGLTERALPVIVPVTFTVSGDDEVIVYATAAVAAGNAGGAIVAFEADEWDPRHGRGWSVSAVGPSRLVTVPERIAELDRLGFAGTVDSGGGYLAVQLSHVRGQALDHPLGGDLEAGKTSD